MNILCVNCVHFERSTSRCGNFASRNNITGEMLKLTAEECRLSEDICGVWGTKFEQDTVENKEGWL